jgi:hypothetical protein
MAEKIIFLGKVVQELFSIFSINEEINKMDKLLNSKSSSYHRFRFMMTIFLFVVICFISSCAPAATPIGEQPPLTQEPTIPSEIVCSGKILTKAGYPIGQAQVEVNGISTETDNSGAFKITFQPNGQEMNNRYVLNV